MPPVSVLIKPASSLCNLHCEYCFYHAIAESREVESYGIMSDSVIEEIVSKVLAFADGYATFSFQGGEPTLCGLEFFENVIRLQKRYNTKNVVINNCIQTNGTLLDEKWAAFLHDNNFLVGLSLDGPKKMHDCHRVDASGQGTYDTVFAVSQLLDKYEVEYNILTVINSQNAKKPHRLYHYYRDNGFRFIQFIPCIDPAGAKRGSFPFSLTNEQYLIFLKGFFDCWYSEISKDIEVSIRYFDNLVRMTMNMPPETCSMSGRCSCQFVFEADGSVYPCDFYVTDEWKLGNIFDLSIREIAETKVCHDFIKESVQKPNDCNKCKWLWLCRGGCRRDCQDNMTGGMSKNCYCEAYKEFFEYAFPRIQMLAKKFSHR